MVATATTRDFAHGWIRFLLTMTSIFPSGVTITPMNVCIRFEMGSSCNVIMRILSMQLFTLRAVRLAGTYTIVGMMLIFRLFIMALCGDFARWMSTIHTRRRLNLSTARRRKLRTSLSCKKNAERTSQSDLRLHPNHRAVTALQLS